MISCNIYGSNYTLYGVDGFLFPYLLQQKSLLGYDICFALVNAYHKGDGHDIIVQNAITSHHT